MVAGIITALLAVMLVVAGMASSEVANDALARDPVGATTVPASVHEGGSVIDPTSGAPVSMDVPDHTIALTFDDGPDPRWTPEVLAVLHKHQVPGTFFVVGSMAARHPELVAAIHDSGSELGTHTFTHPDLVDVSRWRMDQEMDQTQLALTGGAGVRSRLFRPPFSSSASALDDLGYQTVLAAGRLGYVSVFTDLDSEDWSKPGVDAIVRNATPANGLGGVVLMHDAGGDRSQTVAALDQLIPQLKAEGYRFTTVSAAVDLPTANQPTTAGDRLSGEVLVGAIGVCLAVVAFLKWLLICVGALVATRLLLMIFVARRHARRRRDPRWRWGPPVTDPVSVIVPAYNEVANIETVLRSMIASRHRVEVIVVDDGSTDGTAELVQRLDLPGVRLIQRPNGGKAAALNTGLAQARHELIVMVDGDTVFEPDTVHRLVQPFADPEVGAVAANVKVANRDSFLTRLQHIEYVIGFNVDRRVHDVMGSMPTIPGAGGAYRRRVLLEVGGLSGQTLAEDTDLTVSIGRAGWRMVYQDTAIAWTEVPATVHQLWGQRFRWTFGTMQAVWKHRRAVVQRGAAGRIGRFGLLHVLLFQILLPAVAPVIDVFLVYGLLFLDPGTTLLLWSSMLVVQLIGGAFAFSMDGERKSALWLLPAQQLVYRQLMYVVLAQSLTAAAAGIRVGWQRMRRIGALTALRRVEVPEPTLPNRPTGRERWLDLLRAAALVRVVLYHATGWGWLSLVFPSMGVMFALAGSLMVRSLDRSPSVDVVGHRIRRLLPPLWLLGAVLVPLMLAHGWSTVITRDDEHPLKWAQLLFWVIPVLDPQSSSWPVGEDATVVLWYLRAYLWFVLLTPLLLRAFRRRPLLSLAAPLAVVALDAALGSPLADGGLVAAGVLDFVTFGACWMLGFAHRDGLLRRLNFAATIGLALTMIALGGLWTSRHPAPGAGFDLNEIPLGHALIGVGAVLLLLRWAPPMNWLARTPVLGRLVSVLSARAITIYLWHNIAIDLAFTLLDRLGWDGRFAELGATAVLTALAVFAFGWVEDLAAGRRPQLLPAGPKPPAAPVPARVGHTHSGAD